MTLLLILDHQNQILFFFNLKKKKKLTMAVTYTERAAI